MSKEAMKLALEDYLSREMPAGTVIGDPKWWAGKIANVLAKQEQGEPVENRFVRELREYGKTNQGAYLFPSWDIHRALKYLDGYTTPQQRTAAEGEDTRRAWVGLTKEDIVGLVPNAFLFNDCDYNTDKLVADVRRIEAKLKEKNT